MQLNKHQGLNQNFRHGYLCYNSTTAPSVSGDESVIQVSQGVRSNGTPLMKEGQTVAVCPPLLKAPWLGPQSYGSALAEESCSPTSVNSEHLRTDGTHNTGHHLWHPRPLYCPPPAMAGQAAGLSDQKPMSRMLRVTSGPSAAGETSVLNLV